MSTPSDIQPLEGKTVIDQEMFFEPERLSYVSASALAMRIARGAHTEIEGKEVVIAGEDLLADWSNVHACVAVLDSILQEYRAVESLARTVERLRTMAPREHVAPEAAVAAIAAAAGGAIAPITATVTSVLGLVSLFREDVEFRGLRTVVDSLTFKLVLAQQLRNHGATKIFVPELFAVDATVAAGSIRARLQEVHEARSAAASIVGPFIAELVDADTELSKAALRNDAAAVQSLTARVSALRRELDPITEPQARADQRLSELETSFSARDEKSGLTGLGRLLRAEALRALNATVVHAQVVSSGGHYRIARSVLRTLITGDGLSATGGAVARWAVLAPDGDILRAGQEQERLDEIVGNRRGGSFAG